MHAAAMKLAAAAHACLECLWLTDQAVAFSRYMLYWYSSLQQLCSGAPQAPYLVQMALLVIDVAAKGATMLRQRNAPSGITVIS